MDQAPIALHTSLQGKGYPILCLHGHPGSGQSMAVFTEHLASRYQTLTPDLRGYGQSQVSTPFTMAAHLADLEALLDRHGIPHCLVLGWSLGGILALELALRQPQRVAGLILVATAARPVGNHPPTGWQDDLLTGVASLANWLLPGHPWVIDALGKRSLYRYLIQQHHAPAYRRLAHEALPAFLQTSRLAHEALNQALRHRYNRLEAVSELPQPALVLCGAADRHIIPEASYETAQALSNSRYVCYPETAHLFPWEIPQQVLMDIDAWLETHSWVWS